ncbi:MULTISPECIES: hypothetical protein [unclassified Acidovorax]|uniref:hypothetical protein n=1 Tax=unclassified Acidovorax TaxID=2684926 RepID=UPI00159FD8E1|nr:MULTISPECIES: hypothetical protein [unclassified Acidovorax]QLA80630.1 hypothetical protein EXV95_08270 [Acidovorax sp. JMULE5]
MKDFDRVAFTALFLATLLSVLLAGAWLCLGDRVWVKWLGSAGLLATLAGVVQLEVSGFFDKIMQEYGDEEKYPYGPPSRITREIIDNPDTPTRTWLRNMLFFRVRTGFWLIVLGTLVQVGAVWA